MVFYQLRYIFVSKAKYYYTLIHKIYSGIAQGRLDVMGGIADYSGAMVLEMPIKEATKVSFWPNFSGVITVHTLSTEEPEPYFKVKYEQLLLNGEVNLDHANNYFKNTKAGSWASYIIGCLLLLHKNKGIEVTGGSFEITSTIPQGKGVSSSAALEIATFRALAKAYTINFSGTEIAKLAQIVENEIVGAPCGLMDQLTIAFAKKNTILPIKCQPDILYQPIQISENIHFIGIDSGIRHQISGASYSDVRIAAFMGNSIIENYQGITLEEIQKCRKNKDFECLKYKGYLANITVKEWDEKYNSILPETILGKDFINRFGETIDSTTKIDPMKTYHVKACTAHPIFENNRTPRFKELLLGFDISENKENILQEMGKLMYESHEAYTKVQLDNKHTDRIVELVNEQYNGQVYGAKITGGGSGGTVCILAYGEEGLQTVKKIQNQYEDEIKMKVQSFY
jgi:galactokinase